MGEAGGKLKGDCGRFTRFAQGGMRGLRRAAALAILVSGWALAGAQAAPATAGTAAPSQAAPPAGQTAPAQAPSSAAADPAPAAAPAKIPVFAVASIKPDKSGSNGVRLMFGPDGFSSSNVPLKFLIREAFGVNDDQISGEPDWAGVTNFDIDAKVDSSDVAAMKNLTFDQRRQMVLALLVDRFGLKYHQETKELSVYALVVAKGGPKLQAAKPGDTYPNGFKGPDGKGAAGMIRMSDGELTAQAVEISNLVRILSQQTGRTVIDKTGLTGKFDFTLKLPTMHGPMPMPHPKDGATPGGDDASPDDTGEASIFTDVEEQLGLKLESQKAPLAVYVIDHIEQPSEN